MIRMLSAEDKLAEIKRLYYADIPRHDQAGLRQGHRPAEVDGERRRTGARGRLHGRPVADAVGLGEAGADEERKVKSRK